MFNYMCAGVLFFVDPMLVGSEDDFGQLTSLHVSGISDNALGGMMIAVNGLCWLMLMVFFHRSVKQRASAGHLSLKYVKSGASVTLQRPLPSQQVYHLFLSHSCLPPSGRTGGAMLKLLFQA